MDSKEEMVERVVEKLLSLAPAAIAKVTRRLEPERAFDRDVERYSIPCPIEGKAGIASANPQIYFRPRKLFIEDDVARLIDIDDIRVGNNSQAAAPGKIPGEFFSSPAAVMKMLVHSSERLVFLQEGLKGKTDINMEMVKEVSQLASIFEAMAVVPSAVDVCQPGVRITVKYSPKIWGGKLPDFKGVFIGDGVFR